MRSSPRSLLSPPRLLVLAALAIVSCGPPRPRATGPQDAWRSAAHDLTTCQRRCEDSEATCQKACASDAACLAPCRDRHATCRDECGRNYCAATDRPSGCISGESSAP